MDTTGAAGIFHRHRVRTARTSFQKGIGNLEPATVASPGLGLKARLKRQDVTVMRFRFSFHIRICDRIPPTRNAPTHVPNHTIMASFVPRSLSMTMSDAMQGTNNVIVTSDTTI
jgi:hypothetical protein